MIKYVSRVSIAFSILINSIVGGNNNQTLSAAQYERKRIGKLNICFIIDFFFRAEGKGHCLDSWVKWKIINNAIDNYEDIAYRYYRKEVGYEKQDTFRRL
jgi:hypothetical protein